MAIVRTLAIKRVGIALVGGVLALLPLAGCQMFFTPLPGVELAVQVDGDVVVVANCDSAFAGDISVDMSERISNKWTTFFDAETGSGWDFAEELRTDSDVWSEVEVSQAPKLVPGKLLQVMLGVDGAGRWASFWVPERGLPEDEWLHPDGTLTRPRVANDLRVLPRSVHEPERSSHVYARWSRVFVKSASSPSGENSRSRLLLAERIYW